MNPERPASAADPTTRSLSPRTLRFFSVATRCLLWLVVAAWVLFLLTWGALHGWIVPRIGEWRPDLERWASSALGVPVKVGSITTLPRRSDGWLPELVPTLELGDVRLYDPEGREALQLPAVRASLSARSLWHLGFEQLHIVRPVLDIRREAGGRILVAGLDLSGPGDDGAATQWFFRQPAFTIEGGTLRWTDDLKGRAPLELSGVELVVRNGLRHHDMRLDGTPPPEWGDRLSLRGRFTEPLIDLSQRRAGEPVWRHWSGELFADFGRVDVARLRTYADLSEWGVAVRSGHGAVRTWLDVERGQVKAATADVDLQDVDVQLGPDLEPLALDTVQGRAQADWGPGGFGFETPNLSFRTRDGLAWPASQVHVRHRNGQDGALGTELAADRIELAPLAAIAERLPLAPEVRRWLAELTPAGRVEGFSARWRPATPASATAAAVPLSYRASGRVVGLALAGKPSGERSQFGDHPVPGRPGVQGATARFELDQNGGRADLSIDQGVLQLPDVFEDPNLALDSLRGRLRWSVAGERIDVWLEDASLSNADAQGTASAHWTTADPATSSARSRFPGILDLTARLTRADATRVHRYLPLVVAPEVRRYVQEAVRGGGSGQVDFRIKGDVYDVPFDLPGTRGEFRISAALKGVDFAFVPPFLQEAGEAPWHVLKGLDAQLVLDRQRLQLTQVQSGVEGAPQVRLTDGRITIANLVDAPTVQVSAHARGPAGEVLDMVRKTPLNTLTGEALTQARMTGPADVRFDLQLPIDDLRHSKVKGTAQFTGNDVQITPDSPLMANATGSLAFSERGFQVTGGRARLYGGEARFEGGMQPDPAGGPARLLFSGQGTATAEGLRDGQLGFVSRLFARAQGSAAYTARLAFRGGVAEVDVQSSLQGMGFALPAPLDKAPAAALPLHYRNEVLAFRGPHDAPEATTDRMSVDLGASGASHLSLRYERDVTTPVSRVLRGSIGLGLAADEAAPVPPQGVLANARLREIDVDAWQRVFSELDSAPPSEAGAATADRAAAATDGQAYLPTVLAASAERVTVDGRTFRDVVIGGSREDQLWRANIDARELNGYVEYRQPGGGGAAGAGSVYARLARLVLAPADASDVEAILQQPSSVPALDIAVDDFVLDERRLGRVEIEAVNRGGPRNREWRLNRLHFAVPEASFNATGNWVATGASEQRRMALNFRLDIADSGKLLTRFGREGTVRGGRGSIEGNIGWLGSPFKIDYPSLSGQLKADIASGQFLKVEPGAAKLLGVLSLQALPRRLVLDFRDVFSEGFAFDFVRGDASLTQGVVATNNLQMKGVNAAVLMEGQADIARETQDLKVVVVPELNAGTASLIATAINPAVGLGTFFAQFLLRQPLQSAATQEFRITGHWADPKVDKVERSVPAAAAAAAPGAPPPASR